MRLNFRYDQNLDSPPRGLTPMLIPGSAAGLARPTLLSSSSCDHLPSTSRRFCSSPLNTPLFYLCTVALILSLPFALPLALSRAMHFVDATRTVLDHADVASLVSFRAKQLFSSRDPAAIQPHHHHNRTVPLSSETPVPVDAALAVDLHRNPDNQSLVMHPHVDANVTRYPHILPPAVNVTQPPVQRNSPSHVQRHHVVDRQIQPLNSPNVQAPSAPPDDTRTANKYRRPVQVNRHAPRATDLIVLDGWSKFSVVRNGMLYLSETFETRLNAQIAPKLIHIDPELFGNSAIPCGSEPHISFSFTQSPLISVDAEIVVLCGRGSACMQHPHIEDVRRLNIRTADGSVRRQYLVAHAANDKSEQTWGPILQPLKVSLTDASVVALRKTCANAAASATRLLSIAQVKGMVKSVGNNSMDAFTYASLSLSLPYQGIPRGVLHVGQLFGEVKKIANINIRDRIRTNGSMLKRM